MSDLLPMPELDPSLNDLECEHCGHQMRDHWTPNWTCHCDPGKDGHRWRSSITDQGRMYRR